LMATYIFSLCYSHRRQAKTVNKNITNHPGFYLDVIFFCLINAAAARVSGMPVCI
jgi:hypothetical protein